MPVISVKNIDFGYGSTSVLENISFDVERGDYIALVGHNGSGKTTLIKILLGLEKCRQGSVKIFGEEINKFDHWDKIGYLPQVTSSFNPLFPATAEEVASLGLLSKKRYPKRLNKNDKAATKKALAMFGVENLKDRLVSELSGGQQQRVFLARAMVSGPEILILDEPSTGLDPQARDSFFEIIKKVNQDKKTTVIFITHDVGNVGKYANKILFLDRQLIFYGKLSEFCESGEMTGHFGEFSQHLICHQHHEHHQHESKE